MGWVANGRTGRHLFHANHGGNIASSNLGNFFALIGEHPDETADALFVASSGVQDGTAGFHHAGVDADEDKFTNERISRNFEGESGQRLAIVGLANYLVAGLRVDTDGLTLITIERRWQVISNKVEDLLNNHATTVTTSDEEEVAVKHTLTKSGFQFNFGNRFFALVEEFLHEGFISLDSFLDKERASVLGLLLEHIGWDFTDSQLMVGIIFVGIGFHINEIDDTTDVFLKTDWQVNRNGVFRQALMNAVEGFVEVATNLVNLVDKADARHTVLGRLAPDGLGLSLDAHFTIENHDRAIEHAK